MKFRYIIGVIIGATIGMILVYFSTGSIGAGNLLVGAVIGALVGLNFAFVPAGGPNSGRQSGMG